MGTKFVGRVLLAAASLCLAGVTVAEPSEIGYERWTPTTNLSGVILNKPPAWYYGTYADQMSLVNVPNPRPRSPYRLIDIEISGDEEQGYLMDGVWVENKGDFKAESWLLHDLSAYDALSLAGFSDIVILDIEQYAPYWGELGPYAMIVKRNVHEFEYELMLEVTRDVLLAKLALGEWRAIDIDVLYNDALLEPNDHAAWQNVRYNAIVVKNDGGNFKVTRLRESESSQDVADAAFDGMQLIDAEPILACVSVVVDCPSRVDGPCDRPTCDPAKAFLSLYVDNGLPFEFKQQLPAAEVSSETLALGRSVDIEPTLSLDETPDDSISSVLVP